MKYKRILCISDLHIPAHHPQAFYFLKALKKHIKPDLIVNGGDELDKHALSMWDSDPDLPSAGDELRISKKYIWELKKIFPKMILLHSNHSSLIYRRALKNGMPRAYLKSYNEFLEVDKGWKWVDDLNLKLSDGSECYFTHGMSSDGIKPSFSGPCRGERIETQPTGQLSSNTIGNYESNARCSWLINPSAGALAFELRHFSFCSKILVIDVIKLKCRYVD